MKAVILVVALATLGVATAATLSYDPTWDTNEFLQVSAYSMEDPQTTEWKKVVHKMVKGFKNAQETAKTVDDLKALLEETVQATGKHPKLKAVDSSALSAECPTEPLPFRRCAMANIQQFIGEVGNAAKCKLPAPGEPEGPGAGGPGAGARTAGDAECGLSAFDCSHGAELNEAECKCDCPGNWNGIKCDGCGLTAEDCKHGSTFAADTCECTGCKAPWTGVSCNTCNLKDAECGKGKADIASCQCVCEEGYTGDRCEKCGRTDDDCKTNGHGESIDSDKCVCKCAEKWGGEPWCTECQLDDSYCLHDGKMVPSQCSCSCSAPWKGDKCEVCSYKETDCMNGSKLNQETCKCDIDCPPQFKGDKCGECDLDGLSQCQHGSWLDETACQCVGGEDDGEKWTGTFKETCARTADSCHKIGKGTFDETACVCKDCVKGWVGELCNSCVFTDAECVSVDDKSGTLDPATCTCKNCPAGWSGPYCKKCDRTQESCANGSKFNAEKCVCECDPALKWKGELCTQCGLEAAACVHGSEFSADLCKCVKCNQPWSGDFSCNKCALKDSDCVHGKFAGLEACTCEPCEGNWIGFKCDTCSIKSSEQCLNGGSFDATACQCKCNQWEGKFCETCPKNDIEPKCKNGGKFRANKCDCLDGCPAEWSGDGDIFCNKCDTEALKAKCAHGLKTVNAVACVCTMCNMGNPAGSPTTFWGGPFCDICGMTDEMCKHGTFDGNACTCVCDKNWSGYDCSTCTMKDSACEHGSVTPDCKCKCEGNWTGELCETCNPALNCGKWATKDAAKCSCTPKHDFIKPGPNDDYSQATCALKPENCKGHGLNGYTATIDAASCQCNCPVNWEGNYFCDQSAPGPGVANPCGHGTPKNGYCDCEEGWGGVKCDQKRHSTNANCRSVGDPHPQTFDGIHYNYYAVGEFKMYWNDNDGIRINTIYYKTDWDKPNNPSHPSYTNGYAFEYNPARRGRCKDKNADNCVVKFAFNDIGGVQCCACVGKTCTPEVIQNCDAGTITNFFNNIEAWGDNKNLVTVSVDHRGPVEAKFSDLDNMKIWFDGPHGHRGNEYDNLYIKARIPHTDQLDGLCGTNADGHYDTSKDCGGQCVFKGATEPAQWFKNLHVAKNEDGLFGKCTGAFNVWYNPKNLDMELNENNNYNTFGTYKVSEKKGNMRASVALPATPEMEEEEEKMATEEWNKMNNSEEAKGMITDDHAAVYPANFWTTSVWPGGKDCPFSADYEKKDAFDEKQWKVMRRLAASGCMFVTQAATKKGALSVKGDKMCKEKLGALDKDRLSDTCTDVTVPDADWSPQDKGLVWDCKTDVCTVPKKIKEYMAAKTLVGEFIAGENWDYIEQLQRTLDKKKGAEH